MLLHFEHKDSQELDIFEREKYFHRLPELSGKTKYHVEEEMQRTCLLLCRKKLEKM